MRQPAPHEEATLDYIPIPDPPTPPVATTAPAEVVVEEDVFDPSEYVKNLIARMDGSKGASGSVKSTSSTESDSSVSKTPKSSSAVPPVDATFREFKRPLTPRRPTRAEEIGVDATVPADPRRLRSQRVSSLDLEKLREAANLTSNSDLKVSACASYTRRAYAELMGASGLMGICVMMLAMANGPNSIAYLASAFCVAIACVTTISFSTTLKKLQATLKHEEARKIAEREKPVVVAVTDTPTSVDESAPRV